MNTVGLILFLGFTGLIILPVIILIIVLVIRGKNQSWTGTIVDKNENEVEEDDKMTTYYSVSVQVDGQREHKIAVDYQRYKDWKVGDKLEKKKGEMWPKKIS